MAEDQKRTFEIPWATLLPIIAVLAGVVAQLRPLVTARPSMPGEKAIEVMAEQNVDARLWQDPLVVAQKAKTKLDAELAARKDQVDRTSQHQLDVLVDHVRKLAEENKVLLLAVMLDSGPYPEQGESRLRARQAVLAGMNESGWVPMDSEHIGYATIPASAVLEDRLATAAGDTPILIPWEACKNDIRETAYPRGAKRAFVLWLPAGSFNPRPLDAFARLIVPFLDSIGNVEVRLIGPANSTGLQCMVEEKKSWKDWSEPRGPARHDVLNRISIISPLATASDMAFLGSDSTVQKEIEGGVIPRTNFQFLRTIAADDIVLRTLINELALRDVYAAPRPPRQNLLEKMGSFLRRSRGGERAKSGVHGDHIVILSEWDSAYGRSLATSFEDEATPKEKLVDDKGNELKPRISSYRYMHGIDGRLPGDPASTNAKDQSPNTRTEGTGAIEVIEGVHQSDFLRRLARQLKEEDILLKRGGERGIRAVGLLGEDIYDKLMILRALRPELPEALFFTNNYDAHFERKDLWPDVRNLIVASPFGGTLEIEQSDSQPPFKQKVAPFRDNNQTSMFAGTLVATGRLVGTALQKEPRLYEIGRRGAHELSRPDVPSPPWLRKWVVSGGRVWYLGGAGLALLLMGLWFSLSIVNPKRKDETDFVHHRNRVLSSTKIWLIWTVPAVIAGVALYAQTHPADQEPLAFLSGISIWPSEMVRLVALLLAVHFLVKARVDLRVNESDVNDRFFLSSLPRMRLRDRLRLQNLRVGLRRWKEHLIWMNSETSFQAEEAWVAYLRRNQCWPRFVRIVTLFSLYLGFSFCAFFALFSAPIVPFRGETAFAVDLLVLTLAVLSLLILTFYVVDAIQLNSNFIRVFTYGLTRWKSNILPGSRRVPPLTEEEISRYHDIVFIAQRTEVVARLIWYPLIVLALLVLARSSFFDNWTWPLSLILIFTLNAMWAIGSAIFLRRAAEQLRETAINNLQLLGVSAYESPARRQMFDEVVTEIRGLKKGAFAPLSEQPFIRAILVPSGGLGLVAVAQYLLDFF